MPPVPVFTSTIDELKRSLRLSGVQGDGERVFFDAVFEVRVGFYDALGATRIEQIKAYANTDAPTTPDEQMRLRAELLEVKWVRLLCLRRMPVLLFDSTLSGQQTWNQEGIVREGRGSELSDEINRLESEITTGLEILAGTTNPPTSRVQATVIGPATTNPPPGSFIYT